MEVTDHRSTTIRLKSQLVMCSFCSTNDEFKISFSSNVVESLTAAMSVMANRRMLEEETHKSTTRVKCLKFACFILSIQFLKPWKMEINR